jgi:hypothetical protein
VEALTIKVKASVVAEEVEEAVVAEEAEVASSTTTDREVVASLIIESEMVAD